MPYAVIHPLPRKKIYLMIIHVENIRKEYSSKIPAGFWRDIFFPTYRTVAAVDGISLSIKKGETVALLGPNGAGKTTTMKMLTGLVYPSSGSVQILGFTPFDRRKEFLMRIGLVMGNKTGLDWDLTPAQSFQLFKKIYRISDSQYKVRLETLTRMLDVQELLDTQVRKLSLGERMKMELIGAILHDPEVLFLDEPTIGLDIISKKKIREFLREIQRSFGVTLLLTSHDMDDVEKVCDRVVVINKGVKVYDDSLQSLIDEYEKVRYVRFIFNTQPPDTVLSQMGEVVEKNEDFYLFKVEPTQTVALISRVTAQCDVIDLRIESVPLEEIIEQIFRQRKSEI